MGFVQKIKGWFAPAPAPMPAPVQLLGAPPAQPATVSVQDGAAAIGEKAIAVGAGSALVMGNNTGIIQLIQQGTQPGTTAQQMRRAYLAHLVRQLNHFALSGETGASQVRLSSVYTALLTERTDSAVHAQRPMEKAPRLSAVEMMGQEPHLVLLGGPGSGKSTFVNIVALAMADELLGADGLGLGLAWLTAPIPRARDEQEDQDKEPPQPQRWEHGALLPVRIVLRDLAAQLPTPGTPITAETVWHHIAGNLRANKQDAFERHLLDELHGQGGLVLFDGLDEVPDADTRQLQIKQAVATFMVAFPRCRIVVTSRTYAYKNQSWQLHEFADVTLGYFTRAQIHGFVQAWFGHMVELARMSEAAGKDGIQRLTRETDRNPSIGELATRPLLLTLMAQIQTERGGSLPENREALYDRVVDMLLNQWENMKVHVRDDGTRVVLPSLAEWLKSSRKQIREQINRLAFEAHRDQLKLEGTADIPQNQLTLALLNASNDPTVMVRQLEDYLCDRAGLLSSQGRGRYQFPHRSFQEYLAACHLTDADFPEALAKLARDDLNRWREVTLLAGAKVARGSPSGVWDLSRALCCKDRDDSYADRHGALLAGQVLADNIELRNVPERHESHLALMRDWQLKLLRHPTLPAQERALAGRTLAELGDLRPEVMDVDAMQFCLVPAGTFTMGGETWEDSTKFVHQVDLPAPYFMARYPVTTAQWLIFVRDGNAPDDDRSNAGLPNDPALFVSFHDALRFCAWLTRRWQDQLPAGWEVGLPSEAEWEKAARGGEQVPMTPQPVQIDTVRALIGESPQAMKQNDNGQRVYPWGNKFDAERANGSYAAIGRASAVGAFATGVSPYGCEEMAGNVWEWTCSLWGTDFMKPAFEYPYVPTAEREDLGAVGDVWRVVRGGSWSHPAYLLRCAARLRHHPSACDLNLGFRVVLRSSHD